MYRARDQRGPAGVVVAEEFHPRALVSRRVLACGLVARSPWVGGRTLLGPRDSEAWLAWAPGRRARAGGLRLVRSNGEDPSDPAVRPSLVGKSLSTAQAPGPPRPSALLILLTVRGLPLPSLPPLCAPRLGDRSLPSLPFSAPESLISLSHVQMPAHSIPRSSNPSNPSTVQPYHCHSLPSRRCLDPDPSLLLSTLAFLVYLFFLVYIRPRSPTCPLSALRCTLSAQLPYGLGRTRLRYLHLCQLRPDQFQFTPAAQLHGRRGGGHDRLPFTSNESEELPCTAAHSAVHNFTKLHVNALHRDPTNPFDPVYPG